jgi:hypothetical protein
MLQASGGVPVYNWEILGGRLPEGLKLDPFTGIIAGTPRRAGRFAFTVQLRDYDEANGGVTRRFQLAIGG